MSAGVYACPVLTSTNTGVRLRSSKLIFPTPSRVHRREMRCTALWGSESYGMGIGLFPHVSPVASHLELGGVMSKLALMSPLRERLRSAFDGNKFTF